ncbi:MULTISPECIES: IS30 family transposase [Brevibacterium]|nr:IS30 family transposase [Brevibacterium sp. FME17]
MLLEGASAQGTARRFRVNTGAVVEWARLAGMVIQMGARGGIEPVNSLMAVPDPRRAYRRLAHEDRVFIEMAINSMPAWSIRAIGRHLGVAASTVSRELRRHRVESGRGRGASRETKYHAGVAHHHTMRSRVRTRTGKLDCSELRSLVVSGLNEKHSPQQVAGRQRIMFPDRPELWVSHETIYQALYVQGRGSLRHELTVVKALRSGRTRRTPASRLPSRDVRPWLAGSRITDRPAAVADRAVPGHWEGDLVVGPDNSGVVTLVERNTRFALIERLPGSRDSATVIDVIRHQIMGLPEQFRQTLTWDQGQEMSRHKDFTIATGCPVFFCDPHSPWQRGSNENLNGLIRDYYPKGTNFNNVSDDAIEGLVDQLNDRPRKTLGFHTPRERLNQLISSVALAP